MKRTPEEERIFRALAQIETPEADLSAALRRAEEPRRIRPVRPLAAAAVLCALLTIGAAAVGFSGAWRYFAPSLPQNAVQTVGASQTSGDYTLTVEEAVVDDSNFMLLLALTRADGEPIDPEASLTTNSMDLEVTVDGHYFGRATDYQLSPDGKTIYICYENTGALTETSILGKPITLTADGVAVRLFDDDGNIRIQCDNPISLSALTEWGTPDFSAVPLVDHVEEIIQTAANGGAALPLFTVEGVPLLTLRGAALTSEGLALVTQDASYVSGDLAYTRSSCEAIIDTRTGARYLCRSGHGAALEDGTWAFLEVFDDCPFTLEDLPYLEVEVSYTVDRILSDQPFWLTFTVEKSSGWKLPLDDVLELDGLTLHPAELRLSALDLQVYFQDEAEAAFSLYRDGTAPVLHLANGTDITTTWHGGRHLDSALPMVSFQTIDANGDRLFIDPAQVVCSTCTPLEGRLQYRHAQGRQQQPGMVLLYQFPTRGCQRRSAVHRPRTGGFHHLWKSGDPRGALTCFPPQKRRARFRARRFPLPGPGKSAMIVRDLSELSHAL